MQCAYDKVSDKDKFLFHVQTERGGEASHQQLISNVEKDMKDTIKADVRETGCEVGRSVELFQQRVQWRDQR
jgi:hypothetical protein